MALESDKFGTISYIHKFYQRIFKKFKDAYIEYLTDYFKEFDPVAYTTIRLNPFIKHERCMTPEEK